MDRNKRRRRVQNVARERENLISCLSLCGSRKYLHNELENKYRYLKNINMRDVESRRAQRGRGGTYLSKIDEIAKIL